MNNCLWCNKTFEKKHPSQKFCPKKKHQKSNTCKDKYHNSTNPRGWGSFLETTNGKNFTDQYHDSVHLHDSEALGQD